MGTYHFITTPKTKEKNNSGFKLRSDNRQILATLGYKDCSYYFDNKKNRLADIAGYYWSFIKLFFRNKEDIIVMQYPLAENFIFNYILKFGKLRGVKFISVVIDINTLRTATKNIELIKKEIESLNSFTALIIHNQVMEKWLIANGCRRPTILIDIFDYLPAKPFYNLPDKKKNNKTIIAFAGNLHKSIFINKLNPTENCKFLLYGFLKKQFHSANANVQWMGEFKAEELLDIINADWGLIWDGAETEYLDNGLGKYLHYNTPHKTSLYIACGLPIIAPSKSAIGEYIQKHKLGICIDKISDCYNLNVPDEKYDEYKSNIYAIRKRLLNGEFLKEALQKSLKIIN
jgi:hypothetical protein